jgi:hypothetical protein
VKTWAWQRKPYEARVLLVPLGASGARTVEQFGADGLDGVAVLDPARANDRVEAVRDADMVVLVIGDLADVDADVPGVMGSIVREQGKVLAALVIDGDGNWNTPRGRHAALEVREAADMVVVSRDLDLASAFVDVLRGGDREQTGTGVA